MSVGLDCYLLLLACAEILCRYVYDTVGVDVERYLDLRDTSRSRSDAGENEVAELLVVSCEFTLALENVDLDLRLVVCCRGEDLALLCRDSSVSVNDLCHDAAHCLNAQRQRSNIKEEKTLNLAAENACLDSSADSYALVGVDALERLLADKRLNCVDNCGNSRRTADHENLVDVVDRELAVCESALNGAHRTLNEVCRKLVELSSCEREIEVHRAVFVLPDERDIDRRACYAGKVDLSLLCGFLKALHRRLVAA